MNVTIDIARFGELIRTFVAMTAELNRAAPARSRTMAEAAAGYLEPQTPETLKARTYDLHRSAVALAAELGIQGGPLDRTMLDDSATANVRLIERLRAEIARLEGGGAPAEVLAERRARKAAEKDAKLATERAGDLQDATRAFVDRVAELGIYASSEED